LVAEQFEREVASQETFALLVGKNPLRRHIGRRIEGRHDADRLPLLADPAVRQAALFDNHGDGKLFHGTLRELGFFSIAQLFPRVEFGQCIAHCSAKPAGRSLSRSTPSTSRARSCPPPSPANTR